MKECPKCESEYQTQEASYGEHINTLTCDDCGLQLSGPFTDCELEELWDSRNSIPISKIEEVVADLNLGSKEIYSRPISYRLQKLIDKAQQ